MDDDSRLEKLINQCKSNDVDVKVDAVTKLQAEFETGIQVNDPDGLINVLKTCLRTSNQHLTAATLSVLPPLLPLLISPPFNSTAQPQLPPPSVSSSTSSTAVSAMVDVVTLRQVLTAFLPPGGVVDRLGDNRERVREKARETLVILGGLALRSSATSSMSSKNKDAKGPETPLMLFEKFLREGGLGSKVWRSREQAILTLVFIRRIHHLFPIRPYLPLLVDTLEDTDAHVRECARQSVVELFTGPAVSDAARADLKKEMTKKSVRKAIVDDVLSKLIAGSRGGNASCPPSEGSESGDTGSKQKEYVPPSLALLGKKATGASTVSLGNVKEISRPASRAAETSPPSQTNDGMDIQPVYITSSRDLENDFSGMVKPFEGKETEHNWAARERAILRVRGMLKGEVHTRYADVFLTCLKDGFIQWSLKALASLRTTVSANTCSLYTELAIALGPSLDPFADTLLTHLLKMAGFTKKIAAQQSQASVTAIISQISSQPRIILPLLWNTLQEKTVQARAFVVAHIKNYLEVHGHRSKHTIETSGGLEVLEKTIRKSLADANIGVRETARICFWAFEDVWRDRGRAVLESLDSIARKQLEKACPHAEMVSTVSSPVTPKNKKSSVAAAIAASRAKAKAIATSPPSLRHQATSTSHAVRAASPPMRRATSPSLSLKSSTSSRPSSPLRSPVSSPSSKSRVASNTISRSVSTSAISNLKHGPPSSSSTRAASPPSPPVDQPSTPRQRTSSPLATSPTRGSILRKAMQTALPASPPLPPAVTTAPTPRNGITNTAVTVMPRPPSLLSDTNVDEVESLLLATTVPIPDDSDSDMDESVNLMSFSAPFEVYRSAPPSSNSRAVSSSAKSDTSKPTVGVSNVLSTGSNSTQDSPRPVVEDALRARAEQAESAAERLLELVEPEEDGVHHYTFPTSLLMGSGSATPISKAKLVPIPVPPVTPVNRSTSILRQAAAFKNSPAHNGHPSSSLLDVLRDNKHETGWWLKRMTVIQQETPFTEKGDHRQELQGYIHALEQGTADVLLLQKLALLCIEHPVADTSLPGSSMFGSPGSPSPFLPHSRSLPSLHSDPWMKDKSFEKLFNALIGFLNPAQGEDEIEYGLIVLWEMLENQALHIEGREGDIFSLLLTIRYCNKLNVLEATNTIRESLTVRIEPVYGLTTMHASLRAFYLESPPAESSNAEVKGATYAFGLIALGKFILRLPAEILEEELPRLRGTLISALNDKSSLVIRESAAASIIAAQLVLRDETHLFALLDGLADEKKNLLTYLFDKHGARGLSVSTGRSGMDKLEKEMKRLDARTSTPPRPTAP